MAMHSIARRWIVLALFVLPGVTLPVDAETPGEVTLRIQNMRWKAEADAASIIRGSVKTHDGHASGTVLVTARSREAARRAAVRYVYVQTVRNIGVSLKEFEALKDQLAEAVAACKELKAKILNESHAAGSYTFNVELAQDMGDIEHDLRSLAYSNFRMVTLLPETIDGKRVLAPTVETALIGALADKQFRVYDWNFVSSRTPLSHLVHSTLSDSTDSAVTLGSRFLANVIVAGRVSAHFSQNNDGIISYIATANLRVIKVDTGQILTAREYAEKGFGQDRTQAAGNALNELSKSVAKALPDELESHLDEYPVAVQIQLTQPEQALEVKRLLESLPGVDGVQETAEGNNTSFRLTSHEKPAALLQRILQGKDYRIAN